MSNNKEDKNIFDDFIWGFANSISQDNINLYKTLSKDNKNKEKQFPEEYWFDNIYPFYNYVEWEIKSKYGNSDDLVFLYQHQDYVDHHLWYFIKKIEWDSCYADKTGTIIKRLAKYFISWEIIEFDYSWEYTYHLPTKVFTKHDEIIDFYRAVQNLYFWHPEKYLEIMWKILIKKN